MAIVKAPALSLAASGNLGAINYTTWRGRAVARAAWSPTIPNTPDQVVIQNFLITAVTNWRTVLTQAMRDAWTEYAKLHLKPDRFGELRVQTGYNLYIGRQIQALRNTGAPVLWPPDDQLQPNGTAMDILLTSGGTRMRWRLLAWIRGTVSPFSEGWAAGPYTSEARHPTSDEWRFIDFVVPPARHLLDGILGQYWWLKVRATQVDGRVANWFEGQTVLVP